jgi:hypothetical protein
MTWNGVLHLPRALATRLPLPRRVAQPIWSIHEDPDALGYVLAPDPLLDVMSAAEWRELERSALLSS